MPNLPWFKLFPKDFLTDDFVLTATNEELGIYTRWICLEWINGGLPNDLAQLAVMGHTTEDQAAAILKRLRCKKKTKRDKILLNKLQEQREFRALQSTKGCKNRGKPKKQKGLQANRIETEREPNANRIETEREPNLNHKTSDTEEEKNPLTPLGGTAPDLDALWRRIVEIYPHTGGESRALIQYRMALSRSEDPVTFAETVLASARVCAEIHKLDPTGNRMRALPGLANFLDGGYREDRSGVLARLIEREAEKATEKGKPTEKPEEPPPGGGLLDPDYVSKIPWASQPKATK